MSRAAIEPRGYSYIHKKEGNVQGKEFEPMPINPRAGIAFSVVANRRKLGKNSCW
jgi:hypothetical protein